MQTEKFARKPFLVDAVQVTEENMKEIADWCKGEIHSTDPAVAEQFNKPVQTWIKVEVHNPANERQTQAFVGDWVLFYNHKFQVFRSKSFANTFEPMFKEVPKDDTVVVSPPTPAVMAQSKPQEPVQAETDAAQVRVEDAVLASEPAVAVSDEMAEKIREKSLAQATELAQDADPS